MFYFGISMRDRKRERERERETENDRECGTANIHQKKKELQNTSKLNNVK